MKDDSSKDEVATPGVRSYEMSDDTRSLGNRSYQGNEIADEDTMQSERTPRMPSSFPGSAVLEELIPSAMLPEASVKHAYGLTMPAAFVEGSGDLATISYFDTQSTRNTSVVAANPERMTSSTSADAILPLLIYAVVQANPSKLVSHVLFIQRFRADSLMRGEGEYCLTNMDAVRSFLMGCDIGSLGLGTDKIIARQYSPVSVQRRYRAGQQIDNMVGSAGKVLGQAADLGLGGYRMLGGLLTRTTMTDPAQQPKTIEEVQSVLAGSSTKATSFKNSILRRPTFSFSVPVKKPGEGVGTGGTEMADIIQDVTDPTTAEKAEQGDGVPDVDAMAPISTVPSISSRLAALPGLSRLGPASLPAPNDKTMPATSTAMWSTPTKVIALPSF